eukprot:TRINITY_DN812_c2_g1_i1.p1 TRINITY_DN812_c2_g1~~TRINITY_DN812_c2_g1_i1.p1  ORF type:complete len:347 (-),score=137.79 TRINITY_DN812_c2_g1_i1:96-1136(-)
MSDTKTAFIAIYSELLQDLLEPLRNEIKVLENTIERMKQVIDYNLLGGKLIRGLIVVDFYSALLGRTLSNEEFKRASILGWCIELLQASFLVLDDVMDASETRRGQPCWYKLPDVKYDAINDGMLLESSIYILLKKWFSNDINLYVNLVDLFHDISYKTQIGQMLDLTTQPAGKSLQQEKFTMETYTRIVTYKTAYYTFYLSVSCALFLAGVHDKSLFANAKSICLNMGEYFQIQDDFLDCYGDPAVTGKIGTDIEDCKCCWLAVQALSKFNDEQKQIFKENYGQKNPEKTAIIKSLYNELDLITCFRNFEEQSHKKLIEQINSFPLPLGVNAFIGLLNKLYKRAK